jgi:hypothetical protein
MRSLIPVLFPFLFLTHSFTTPDCVHPSIPINAQSFATYPFCSPFFCFLKFPNFVQRANLVHEKVLQHRRCQCRASDDDDVLDFLLVIDGAELRQSVRQRPAKKQDHKKNPRLIPVSRRNDFLSRRLWCLLKRASLDQTRRP